MDTVYLENHELRWARELVIKYLINIDDMANYLEVKCFNEQLVNELRSRGIEAFNTDIN